MIQFETIICIALDNNRFVTKEGWATGKYSKDEVVGIAVRTPAVSFIVGLTEWKAKWTDRPGKIITKRHTEAEALQIISGLEDTRKIVEAQNNEDETAAKFCWNYGHKERQWYLPSLLELTAICVYRHEINELMECVGGAPLSTRGHWSSTEDNANFSWVVYFGDGFNYVYRKFEVCFARPCCHTNFVLQV